MAEYGAVAKPSCTTCYLSWDHVRSVRMLTDGSGNVVARHDYLPFGEEIPAGYAGRSASLLFGASDGIEQKFTGQIRDSETGMDFFPRRYYASAVGRFTSPDPMNLGADLLDPQSWNAYAYVRNNPLALVDPMRLCTFDAEGNAVEDENGACYEGGFGGSVTVTAQAPPDVMPIFVSLPSLLSDNQQPAPTAPPPAVREAGVGVARPTKNGTAPQTCASNKGGAIWTGTVTFPLTELGAFFGSLIGPAGTLPGALVGSMFGFGGTASFVPSTRSVYVGLTIQAGLAINGGSGGSINVVNVPAGQNPNSIANGPSYSVTYQPRPFAGSTVTKSPGSGGPVVGPSAGSKVSVSGSASYNICLWNCGCGG